MKILPLLLVIAVGAAVAGYVYQISSDPSGGEDAISVLGPTDNTDAVVTVDEPVDAETVDIALVDSDSEKETPAEITQVEEEAKITVTSDADVTTVALNTLSDGDFNNLVADLEQDPTLLPKLLEEYRSNTDPARARRMAQILKSRQDTRITALGQEMVYSGDAQSQHAGFALLAGQQGSDPAALETVVEMIEIEADPTVLRSAMGALSIPGETQGQQQERVLDQFSSKADHDDPMVRRLSLSLMSRWEGDRDMNEYYISGLSDADERVRTGALFSLKASNYQSDAAKQALVGVAQDGSAGRLLRLNAISLLKRYDVSEQELADLKKQVLGSS